MDQARIAIIGASGYTGAELARLIVTHPRMRIAALAADRNAGRELAEIYPHLAHLALPTVVKTDEIDWSQIDLAFCGLPHATAQEVIGRLPKDLKVVDLSADFRLRDPAVYEAWYGHAHHALDLQAEAVYGLPEFYRDEIRTTRICAGSSLTMASAATRCARISRPPAIPRCVTTRWKNASSTNPSAWFRNTGSSIS
mgnify:CR=1 FL=1